MAEYFARFQLSKSLSCSIEVRAPMLTKIPLYIRPPLEQDGNTSTTTRRPISNKVSSGVSVLQNSENRDSATEKMDVFDDLCDWHDEACASHSSGSNNADADKSDNDEDKDDDSDTDGDIPENIHARQIIHRGAEAYLRSPVEFKNVAHSSHPVRNIQAKSAQGVDIITRERTSIPTLEVGMVIYGGGTQSDSVNVYDDDDIDAYTETNPNLSPTSSPWVVHMTLVRMVNNVPLLDGAEARACGLVQGIASMKTTWKTFGLDISIFADEEERGGEGEGEETSNDTRDGREIKGNGEGALSNHEPLSASSLNIPMFEIRDATELAPYFRTNTHDLFEIEEEDETEDDDLGEQTAKRRARKKLPAGIRIGNVLMIVQLHATPSALPLPTLSKVS